MESHPAVRVSIHCLKTGTRVAASTLCVSVEHASLTSSQVCLAYRHSQLRLILISFVQFMLSFVILFVALVLYFVLGQNANRIDHPVASYINGPSLWYFKLERTTSTRVPVINSYPLT